MRDPECRGLALRRKAGGGPAALALLAAAAVVLSGPPARTAQPEAPVSTAAPVPAPLLARAASLDPGWRQRAIAELQELGTPAAWHLVTVMLQRDFDARVRWSAAVALGASHDPDVEPMLAAAARMDPDPAVRSAAAVSRAAVAPFGLRPKVAAGFSLLCPGCGYFYLGDTTRALGFLGAAAALVGTGFAVLEASPLVRDADGNLGHDGGRAMPLFMAAQNLWFYGIFASYRDARLARGDIGWKYPVAREDLTDLLAAPFNPQVLRKPWVWAGLPIMLGAAVGATFLIASVTDQEVGSPRRTLADPGGVQFFGETYGKAAGIALGETYNLSLFLPVGVGEEALFRGVIQAGLMETPLGLWGGWAVGSAIFGAVHTFNFIGAENGTQTAALAVPYLMVTGSYLGYVYIRTNFSLAASTAIHFWYDFALATLDFIFDPDGQPFVARFGTTF
jgi:membrane protease YdiL (CAAX protease family)